MLDKTKKISFWSLLGLFLFMASLQNSTAQTNTPAGTTEKWVAGKVNPTMEAAAADSLMMELELAEEEEAFPADELYDNWNTEFVKAYGDTQIPDTFRFDVSGFIMPFQGKVTSNYGPRRRRFHYGTDFKLQVGDTVVAAFDGKVRVKRNQGRRKGYGNFVVLRHPNGLETVYGHLSKFLVEQDEIVKAGQAIALGGNTGRSTGSHLHFEFRFLGQAINPGEIIDLEELTIKDDQYVFLKSQSSKSYSGTNPYTASGDQKLQYYRVREGDNLYKIARKYGTTVQKLCKLNNMKETGVLRAGRSIRIS